MKSFQHDQSPFFCHADTGAALTDLSAANRIVIYCGAGVTYDLTGLGWDGLVEAIFEEAKDDAAEYNSEIDHLISCSSLEAKQKASMVMAYLQVLGRISAELSRSLLQIMMYMFLTLSVSILLRPKSKANLLLKSFPII
ncbi:MAG: hypothetical protein Q4A82_07525 [Corynebacterium sp.]|nr:hypothetical protein [Corynebacterium sp.]